VFFAGGDSKKTKEVGGSAQPEEDVRGGANGEAGQGLPQQSEGDRGRGALAAAIAGLRAARVCALVGGAPQKTPLAHPLDHVDHLQHLGHQIWRCLASGKS